MASKNDFVLCSLDKLYIEFASFTEKLQIHATAKARHEDCVTKIVSGKEKIVCGATTVQCPICHSVVRPSEIFQKVICFF